MGRKSEQADAERVYGQLMRLGRGHWRSGVWPGSPADRRRANRNMRPFRAVPRPRMVQKVVVTATELSRETQERGIKGFANGRNVVWMRSRKLSKVLVEQDRLRGGMGYMVAMEYRHCRNCGRLLLADEARDYRELMRRPIEKWDTPKGPKCWKNCEPRAKRRYEKRTRPTGDANAA